MPEFGSWRPIHDTHAIEVAAVTLTFSEPVGDVTWRKAQSLLEPITEKHLLLEQTPIGIAWPQELRSLGIANPIAQGTAYTRQNGDGSVAERVQVTRNSIKFEDYSYIRWAPFRDRFRDICAEIALIYSGSSSILSIQSEYLDSFESLVDKDRSDSTDVVDPESSLVASSAMRTFDNWHCHSGWFDRHDEFRRLVNINVDIADRNEPLDPPKVTRMVRIKTMAADQFGPAAGFEPDDRPLEWSRLSHHLDSEHDQLKDLLRSVLTKSALEAISL